MTDNINTLDANGSLDPLRHAWTFHAAATTVVFDGQGSPWFGFSAGSVGYIDRAQQLNTYESNNAVILTMEGLGDGCLAAGDSGLIERFGAGSARSPVARTQGWTDYLQLDQTKGVGFAASARTLSAFSLEDGTVWSANNLPGAPTGMALRHDGGAIAISHRKGFTIYDKSGHVLAEHILRGVIRSLAWRPDGRYLCGTLQEGDLMLWQPADDGEGLLASQWGYLAQTCWSANSRWLASASGSAIILWSFADRTMPIKHFVSLNVPEEARIVKLIWHPSLSTLGIGTNRGDVFIWSEKTDRFWRVGSQTCGSSVTAMSWSVDGALLVAAFKSGRAEIYGDGLN